MSYNDGYGGERRQERRDDYEDGGDRRQERRDDYGGGGRQQEGGYGRQDDGYGRQEGGYGRQDDSYSGGSGYGQSQQRYDDDSGRRPEGGHHSGGGQHSSGTPYGGGGGYDGGNLDSSAALSAANEHAGRSREDNIFASVFDNLMGKQTQLKNDDVDEQGAVQAHQQMYGNQGGGQASNGNMGAAAAMQALKMFTGGQGGSSAGQGGQSQFVGMAMAQAAKLFDQQSANGNTHSSASKEGAIQNAAEMALKMYMKSQMGGGGSSSASGLLSMASKFMS